MSFLPFMQEVQVSWQPSSLCKIQVEVEFIKAHAGLDIGDTAIGMHVKHVQVPIRPLLREIGHAHVTALASRPKLIGGARAHYPQDSIRKS